MLITTFGLRRSGNHLVRRWVSPEPATAHVFVRGISCSRPHPARFLDDVDSGVHTLGVEDGTYRDIAGDDQLSEIITKTHRFINVVRDPINTLASYIQASRQAPSKRGRHLREDCLSLGIVGPIATISHRFPCFLETPPDGRIVLYEKFIASAEYREDLARWLCIDPCEDAFRTVSHQLGGSSFSGSRVPTIEEATNRWRLFKDDPYYLWYLQSPGLLSSREQLYGPLPPELEERIHG